jgi:hypothetical protein
MIKGHGFQAHQISSPFEKLYFPPSLIDGKKTSFLGFMEDTVVTY